MVEREQPTLVASARWESPDRARKSETSDAGLVMLGIIYESIDTRKIFLGHCVQRPNAKGYARAMSWGRMGMRGRVRPVALRMAAATAALEEMVGGSPMPLAP